MRLRLRVGDHVTTPPGRAGRRGDALGEHAAAVPGFDEVVVCLAISGRTRAILLADYAEALVEHGCNAQANAALTEAAQIVTTIGDELGAGRVRAFQADLAIADHDWPAARTNLEAAMEVLTTHDDTTGQIRHFRSLAS